MIITKLQGLSILQIENLHIPFSEEEERLLASIPSHVIKENRFDRGNNILFS